MNFCGNCESFPVHPKIFQWKTRRISHRVFHNLWKEKMEICEKKSKNVRKYKTFSKLLVENHVENVDKNTDIFPHESVEKKK